MVVCPVCEHAQAGGWECEVCGRRLEAVPDSAPGSPAGAPAIGAMEGLEPSALAVGPDATPEPVLGLEPTTLEQVTAPPASAIPDLELTGTEAVDPPVDLLPGLERVGDDAPAEEPTPYPAVVVCRYCRTEAAPGDKICNRCGMRLPTVHLPAPEPGAEEPLRLCTCGVPIRGPRCPSCGARTG